MLDKWVRIIWVPIYSINFFSCISFCHSGFKTSEKLIVCMCIICSVFNQMQSVIIRATKHSRVTGHGIIGHKAIGHGVIGHLTKKFTIGHGVIGHRSKSTLIF